MVAVCPWSEKQNSLPSEIDVGSENTAAISPLEGTKMPTRVLKHNGGKAAYIALRQTADPERRVTTKDFLSRPFVILRFHLCRSLNPDLLRCTENDPQKDIPPT